mmetsp:Transcript_9003/g.16221  ORF Transcript_9003/g.16221 Transcript_9003/m.16221 type:complete len:158 (-) Transcript_9003:388-861(-)
MSRQYGYQPTYQHTEFRSLPSSRRSGLLFTSSTSVNSPKSSSSRGRFTSGHLNVKQMNSSKSTKKLKQESNERGYTDNSIEEATPSFLTKSGWLLSPRRKLNAKSSVSIESIDLLSDSNNERRKSGTDFDSCSSRNGTETQSKLKLFSQIRSKLRKI